MTMDAVTPCLILVNGPNLNRLGTRNPALYGSWSLMDIEESVGRVTREFGVELRSLQSNSEGAIIDFLQQHVAPAIGIVINPGALGHYGYALRDCLEDLALPTIEVHISNVHRREEFRHTLVLASVVQGQIVGLGPKGYEMAARHLLNNHVTPRVEER